MASTRSTLRATVACVAVTLGTSLAPAQPSTVSPAPAPPLAGPRIVDDAPAAEPRPSILARGFDGLALVPEIPPEEAALRALRLDAPGASPERRAAHDAILALLAERARALDTILADNLDLLVMLNVAQGTDDGLDILMLGLKAYEVLAPLRAKGPLRAQVRALLPEPDAAAFDEALDEFWRAIVRDRRAQRKADGTRPARGEVVLAVRGESFGREVERSFQRLAASGELLYRYATRGITLTKPQQRRLRELAADHAARGDRVGDDDTRRLFLGALRTLDVSQRPRFIRNLRGG